MGRCVRVKVEDGGTSQNHRENGEDGQGFAVKGRFDDRENESAGEEIGC